jgi:hypothetical protein
LNVPGRCSRPVRCARTQRTSCVRVLSSTPTDCPDRPRRRRPTRTAA